MSLCGIKGETTKIDVELLSKIETHSLAVKCRDLFSLPVVKMMLVLN